MKKLFMRLYDLIYKLLSFKFVIFVIACLLRTGGYIGGGEWSSVAVVTLTGHMGMKYLQKGMGGE